MTSSEWWDLSLKTASVLLVAVGAVVGGIKYINERRKDREQLASDRAKDDEQREKDRVQAERDRQLRAEDLNWRRAQFLLQLANSFDDDPYVKHVLDCFVTKDAAVAEGDLTVALRERDVSLLSDDQKQLRYAVDRFLDFFDRLAGFIDGLECLRIEDLSVFSWYLSTISGSSAISNYAVKFGYEHVLAIGQELFSRMTAPLPVAARRTRRFRQSQAA